MDFSVRDIEINDVPYVGVTLGRYPEATFILTEVKFVEEDNGLRLVYHYNIIEGEEPRDRKKFDIAVGDFIMHYIETSAEQEHPLVFKGGT